MIRGAKNFQRLDFIGLNQLLFFSGLGTMNSKLGMENHNDIKQNIRHGSNRFTLNESTLQPIFLAVIN